MRLPLLLVGALASAWSQEIHLSRAPPLVSVRLAGQGFFQNFNRGRLQSDVPLSEISENSHETNIRFQNDIPSTRTSESFQETDTREFQSDSGPFVATLNSNRGRFQSDIPLSGISENSLETDIRFQSGIPSAGISESFQGANTREFKSNSGTFQATLLTPIVLTSAEGTGRFSSDRQSSQDASQITNQINQNPDFQFTIPSTFSKFIQQRPSEEAGRSSLISDRQSSRDSIQIPNQRNQNHAFQFTIPPTFSNVLQQRTPENSIRSSSIFVTAKSPEQRVFEPVSPPSVAIQNPPFQFTIPSVFSNDRHQKSLKTTIRSPSTFVAASSLERGVFNPLNLPSGKSPSPFVTNKFLERGVFKPLNLPSGELPSPFVTASSPEFGLFEPLNLPSGARALLGTISTTFSCEGLPYGYYADSDNSCKVFHICNPALYEDGYVQTFQYSFMCGETLVFDQQELACVTTRDVTHSCKDAPRYFFRNEIFGTQEEA